MDKKNLIGLALVSASIMVGFTACNKELRNGAGQETEIKLTTAIIPTRVNSLDYQSTQIVTGQQVGVTIEGAKTEHKNVSWVASEDGTLTNTGDVIYWANENVTITAYHPYEKYWYSTNEYFSVSTDQSNEQDYRNSDLLWATKTSSKTENAIPLIFSHKLAKINITLLPENENDDLSGASIYICGTKINTNFNPTTGELSDATSANVQEIKAGITTKDVYTASAIVIPQTVDAGTQFIRVVHGDKIYSYTIEDENKELKAGYSHNYTLTVNEHKVEVTLNSANITNWNIEENKGEIGEVYFDWFNPNQYVSYTANYEQVSNIGDYDYFYNYRSRVNCPISSSDRIGRIELKVQMNAYPESSASNEVYLCCENTYYDSYDALYMTPTSLILKCDNDKGVYSWYELGVKQTDCMVINISFQNGEFKVNDVEKEYRIPIGCSFSPDYFFTYYYREYDEGEHRNWKGSPEGSKFYYVKVWDENENLIYLGSASTALNPKTNTMEYCWHSYCNGEENYEFAHYPTTHSNYLPYGGGIDE